MTALDRPTMVAFAGMGCIVRACRFIPGHERPSPFVQHVVNLAGAALLTISLLYHLNLASLVLEGFWASIAIWGLWKAFRKRTLA
ncbi:CBU_0592 family membrane protein [Croceicoccus marinus]|jgi:hypothetical protein|uniref:Permease n=1 Tax=Croceicoccus marinus TaxID=450378 RepID=A0A7G6VRH3_9SPHN|nr:permease [Croceicoccus marinus]QNE04338.1 permease [Croceicoccus marinus]